MMGVGTSISFERKIEPITTELGHSCSVSLQVLSPCSGNSPICPLTLFLVVSVMYLKWNWISLLFIFLFLWDGVWTQGFALTKQELYCLSHTTAYFCSGYFGNRVFGTSYLGCSRTTVLLISSSQVARITCVSHSHISLAKHQAPKAHPQPSSQVYVTEPARGKFSLSSCGF
jgi:hypothetical protein